ncbi:nuclease-related domain-containing protein [Cytobacillus sp. FJAT-54145]|uniref:Nuclease-related domain-containing protein n=1 Tax=Cytobacillus spartinae TaxID=3299023 RepID=A0ABW6KAU8_9BACI
MDTLILSPYFLLILEIKNISGTVLFDNYFQQMLRTINGIEEGFPDPLLQAKRQKIQLAHWLTNQHFADIPIEYLIVFSNPSTILKTNPNNKVPLQRVCHAAHLTEKIEHFSNLYREEKFSQKTLKKFTRTLLKNHTVAAPNTYEVSSSDIISGVECPTCNYIPMSYYRGNWLCPLCKTKSNTAQHQAVLDYFLLIEPTITNQQLRKFINLPSPFICSRILSSMKLKYSGNGKGRVYHSPYK